MTQTYLTPAEAVGLFCYQQARAERERKAQEQAAADAKAKRESEARDLYRGFLRARFGIELPVEWLRCHESHDYFTLRLYPTPSNRHVHGAEMTGPHFDVYHNLVNPEKPIGFQLYRAGGVYKTTADLAEALYELGVEGNEVIGPKELAELIARRDPSLEEPEVDRLMREHGDLVAALTKIAFEPFGPSDASDRHMLNAITDLARTTLKNVGVK